MAISTPPPPPPPLPLPLPLSTDVTSSSSVDDNPNSVAIATADSSTTTTTTTDTTFLPNNPKTLIMDLTNKVPMDNDNDKDKEENNNSEITNSDDYHDASKTSTVLLLLLHVHQQRLCDAQHQFGLYSGPLDVTSGLPHGSNGIMEYQQDDDTTTSSSTQNKTIMIYHGDWKHGLWHGSNGRLQLLEQNDEYQGDFEHHTRHGQGTYTWSPTMEVETTKNTNDTTTTTTTTTTTNSTTGTTTTTTIIRRRWYQGDFVHNQRCGQGKYTWETTTTITTTNSSGSSTTSNDDDDDDDEEPQSTTPSTTTSTTTSTYVGSFDHYGRRCGHGVYTSPTVSYTGEWYDGDYHGYGELQQQQQEKEEGEDNTIMIYRGMFDRGQKHGPGQLIKMMRNVEREQEKKNDDQEGMVVLYDGMWQNDHPIDDFSNATNMNDNTVVQKEGENSKEIVDDKDHDNPKEEITIVETPTLMKDAFNRNGHYKGMVIMNSTSKKLPHGIGTMIYDDHHHDNHNHHRHSFQEYEGFWKFGQFHGHGRLTFTMGGTYEGNFENNLPHGNGQYTTCNDTIYKGIFHQGHFHGKDQLVIYHHINDDLYQGSYQYGQPHGYGMLEFGNMSGSYYKGEFDQGQYHGEGTLVTPDIVYNGTFVQGQPQDMVETVHSSSDGDLPIPLPPNDTCLIDFVNRFIIAKTIHRDDDDDNDGNDNGNDDNELKISAQGQGYYGRKTTSSFTSRPNNHTQCLQNNDLTKDRNDNNTVTSLASSLYKAIIGDATTSYRTSVFSSKTTRYLKNTPCTTTTNNNNNPTSGSDEEKDKGKDDCRPVVNQAVLDSQGNPGRYTGLLDYKTNRPHGVGRMVYDDGERIHEGFWVNGHRQGHGRCVFRMTGDFHEGNYRQNLRQGPGLYKWKDGRIYKGWYHQDERHGHGKFVYPNGNVYEGEFEYGQRHGKGTMIFGRNNEDGRYHGEWQDGLYHGMGRLEWKDDQGKRHVDEGQFGHGKMIKKSNPSVATSTKVRGDIQEIRQSLPNVVVKNSYNSRQENPNLTHNSFEISQGLSTEKD